MNGRPAVQNHDVEAMWTEHADVVCYGPVSYVQAAERAGAEALVTPAGF
jgi:ABC-type phosphate/phosphonate transport system substrate-binding protein